MTAPSTPKHSTPSSVSALDMRRAQDLISGYLKNSLSADDQAWMAQFLVTLRTQGGTVATEFEQEMAWVAQTQAQLSQAAPVFDTDSGWQRLQARLDTPRAAQGELAAKPAQVETGFGGVMRWAKQQFQAKAASFGRLWQKPAVGFLASAMIVSQMGLLAAVVHHLHKVESTQSAEVTPAAGSKAPQDGAVLVVVFKDNTSLLDMRMLLRNVHGEVVGGPGAMGVWEISVPKESVAESMKLLSASNLVYSVNQ